MKKGVIILFLLGVLLVSPLILAQEESQTYSGFNRFVDNVKIFFASGDNEVRLALDIREKEVNSAINNIQNQGEDKAIKNLERAKEKLQVVQEKVSLDTSEEIKTSVDKITDKINEEEDLPDEFDEYLLEEEKTQLTAVLTEKTFEYCEELAKEDFASMLKDEECNPETAIPGLEKDLEKLEDLQLKMFVQLMLEIRSCVDDPGTCNCEANVDVEQKEKCEEMVALALKCEYNEDENACDELEAMKPEKGDNFAESFVPDFLMNLFREKEGEMISYDTEPSDCVPEECWDWNDKPECRQYDKFKETKEDWDEDGNFIGTRDKCMSGNNVMTMQESIPECFDGDVFLEEKCGEITMVENEDGLINYIIGNEVNGIIGDFENKSAQRRYAPGTSANGTMGNGTWTVDEVWEIKEEMNQIKNQIKNITYAPGTTAGGKGGVVVDGDINGGYVPGTGPGGDVGVVVDGDGPDVVSDEGVVADDMTVDNGPVDREDEKNDDGDGVDDGVDPGPDGIVGVIEGTGEPGPGDEDSGGDSVPITGGVIGNSEDGFGGPSVEDSDCLYKCVVTEGKEESVCMIECGVEPEPANEGEVCMQKCIVRGCEDKYDIKCQNGNIFSCENECGMIEEPEAQNEAEQCIRDCINEIDPNIECSHGTFEGEGETGNGDCQKCAKSCEYLYAGPCLTDELWVEIEDACMVQGEYMEAVPVMGDSGQGYECTIYLECFDRSDEVGDNPGTGLGIVEAVGDIMGKIGDFFKGFFGGGGDEDGGNDVAGVDDGPGESGVVDED